MGFLELDGRIEQVIRTIGRVRHSEEESHKLKWCVFRLEEDLAQKEKNLVDLRMKYYNRKSQVMERDSNIKGLERELCQER